MANIMSSMKIPIQTIVSKNKKRYTEDGFNLDLSYILPNLIAMGFPAKKLEGCYRNNYDQVLKFFELKHKENYKIYNLCSERSYDTNKFHSVATYPFEDHNPPNIEQIEAFCDDVHKWLKGNKKHIAAVHCKAGKGRTGTMICCYMLHDGKFTSAADALSYYAQQRTHDHKGVTIPSQRRYVEYYSRLLISGKTYSRIPLQICEMKLSSPPLLNSHQGTVHFSISYVMDSIEHKIYKSEVPEMSTNSDGYLVIGLDRCIALTGDIKVEFYSKAKFTRKNTILFQFWFNTYFVKEETAVNSDNPYFEYMLPKSELDYAHKDKKNKLYPPDFKIQVSLQQTPPGSYVRGADQNLHNNHHSNISMNSLPEAHTPSESPEASSSGSSTGEDWESGEFKTIEQLDRPKQRKINKTKLVKTNVNAAKQPQQFKAKTSNIKIANSNGIKKMRWLTSMRSDPDLRETLAKNVNIRMRQSNDSLLDMDYYSTMCDKQLSVGSPCKSPSELLIKSMQSNTNMERTFSDCKVLVLAKPVESQSIGFKVDDNNCVLASEKLPCDSLCSNKCADDGIKLCSANLSASLGLANFCRNKQKVSETYFKHKLFNRNGPSQTKTNDVPSLCVSSDVPRAHKCSSFTFKEFRQELQSAIRHNSSKTNNNNKLN